MKKRIVATITICTILMTFIFTLSGCSGAKLSGIYVNESNNAEYLKFSGKSEVSLRSNEDKSLYGSYRIKGDTLVVFLISGLIALMCLSGLMRAKLLFIMGTLHL